MSLWKSELIFHYALTKSSSFNLKKKTGLVNLAQLLGACHYWVSFQPSNASLTHFLPVVTKIKQKQKKKTKTIMISITAFKSSHFLWQNF